MRIVNIIKTVIDDAANNIVAGIGEYFGNLADSYITSKNTDIWQQYGFASKPNIADGEGCAEGLLMNNGSEDVVINTRDVRYSKVLGKLDDGDVALYSGINKNSVSLITLKNTGNIMLYAPTEHDSSGTPTHAHLINMDPDGDAVTIAHQNGSYIILKKENIIIKSANGSQSITISDDGISLIGNISLTGNISVKGNMNTVGSIIGMTPPIINGTPMVVP